VSVEKAIGRGTLFSLDCSVPGVLAVLCVVSSFYSDFSSFSVFSSLSLEPFSLVSTVSTTSTTANTANTFGERRVLAEGRSLSVDRPLEAVRLDGMGAIDGRDGDDQSGRSYPREASRLLSGPSVLRNIGQL
jgi:hypothetical protein